MHRNLKPEDVLKEGNERGVTQVFPIFCDVLGRIKSHQIPFERLPRAFERGVVIDGSSVEGFARINESDLRATPDPRTFRILPWTIGAQTTGVILCDVIEPTGRPFVGDPRQILRRVLNRCTEREWTVNVGPEAEFFYFANDAAPTPIDQGGYYDLVPNSRGLDLCTMTVDALRRLGIECEAGHHEVAPSQYEIDLRYRPALEMADQSLLYRLVVKRVAQDHGAYATFMPKPVAGVNGSGMHVHLSIFDGEGKNLFFDEQNTNYGQLSPMALNFLAGLLEHAPALAAVTNPWINSYKRLVPGYEAPVYICWGRANRSALVRVPNYEPGHDEATRLEARFPDPSCNPYLAFALLIAAGLDGIERKLEPPAPVEEDVYHLPAARRAELGIGSLPGDLDEALRLFEASALAKTTLGEHTFESIRTNINTQLEAWRLAVTDWEIKQLFSVL